MSTGRRLLLGWPQRLVLGVGISREMSPTPRPSNAARLGAHVFHARRLPLAASRIVVKLQLVKWWGWLVACARAWERKKTAIAIECLPHSLTSRQLVYREQQPRCVSDEL